MPGSSCGGEGAKKGDMINVSRHLVRWGTQAHTPRMKRTSLSSRLRH
jgi:hypothetical protein